MKNILNGLSKFFKPGWLKVGLWLGLGLLAVLLYSHREYPSKVTWFELRGWPFNFLTLERCSLRVSREFCATGLQAFRWGWFVLDCMFWYVCACVLIEIRKRINARKNG